MSQIREKLLQARELERVYQEKHRLGQYNAQAEFTTELKQLDIQSISEYHELVKAVGYKGRTFKVMRIPFSSVEQAIYDAIEQKEDVLIAVTTSETVVYIGSTIGAGKDIDKNFCQENNIPLIPIGLHGSSDWVSVAGNPCIEFVIMPPIQSSFANVIMQAIADMLKEQYELNVTLDGNDCIVKVGDVSNKICGIGVGYVAGALLIGVGISMKLDKELCANIHPGKAPQKTPNSIEDLVGREINPTILTNQIIQKLGEVTESAFV